MSQPEPEPANPVTPARDQTLDVTDLLLAWRAGDTHALDRLIPLVYEELRRLARFYLSRESRDQSVQTTALVNEVYLRLVNVRQITAENRAHFFAIAANLLRQILVDLARRRSAQKRGRGQPVLSLDEGRVAVAAADDLIPAIDEAMQKLSQFDPRKAQVVELRFFGGMSIVETAGVLGVSPETVKRDWRLAKSWLKQFLEKEQRDEP